MKMSKSVKGRRRRSVKQHTRRGKSRITRRSSHHRGGMIRGACRTAWRSSGWREAFSHAFREFSTKVNNPVELINEAVSAMDKVTEKIKENRKKYDEIISKYEITLDDEHKLVKIEREIEEGMCKLEEQQHALDMYEREVVKKTPLKERRQQQQTFTPARTHSIIFNDNQRSTPNPVVLLKLDKTPSSDVFPSPMLNTPDRSRIRSGLTALPRSPDKTTSTLKTPPRTSMPSRRRPKSRRTPQTNMKNNENHANNENDENTYPSTNVFMTPSRVRGGPYDDNDGNNRTPVRSLTYFDPDPYSP
jgi:hypothetical protein